MTYGPRPAGGNIAPPVGVAGTMTDSTAPATLPDLPGGPYDIEFFFDPGCPFAWPTSQWVRRLVELKDIKVGWRFISLKFINENNENMPAGYLEAAEKGLRYHRICAAARDRLEPGGRVLALVPNIQVWYILGGLLRGRWDYADQGTLDRTHLRFFTKATMIELFEGAGLDVELIRGVNDVSSGRRLRDYRRSAVKNLEWLPRVVPDSRWLHFVVVAGVHAAERPASD